MSSEQVQLPPTMQPTSAMATVMSTYELLENVIASLPPQDVLVAATVSKTWLDMIQRSTVIQKSVFHNRENTFLNPFLTARSKMARVSHFISIDFASSKTSLLVCRTGTKEIMALVSNPAATDHRNTITIVDGKACDVNFEYEDESTWHVRVRHSSQAGMVEYYRRVQEPYARALEYLWRFHTAKGVKQEADTQLLSTEMLKDMAMRMQRARLQSPHQAPQRTEQRVGALLGPRRFPWERSSPMTAPEQSFQRGWERHLLQPLSQAPPTRPIPLPRRRRR